jgi:hypothetical protein
MRAGEGTGPVILPNHPLIFGEFTLYCLPKLNSRYFQASIFYSSATIETAHPYHDSQFSLFLFNLMMA